jgi:transcriptional regulator with XRE-family HTH domain
MTTATTPTAGDYLRTWRHRRRMSQLDFALDAEISQRHLSFLESGRSAPSRDMLLHLAERLDVPLRERNAMLLAAGFAPVYSERHLDDPAMAAARVAIETVLRGHEPFPALAVDRHWNLVTANRAVAPLLVGVEDTTLLVPPLNVLRVSLHPNGLAPRIANLGEWRAHLLDRLRRQIAVTSDIALVELLRELSGYPGGAAHVAAPMDHAGVFMPLRLMSAHGMLSLISTTTVFGTPRDLTLAELAVEAFFPADDRTRKRLENLSN